MPSARWLEAYLALIATVRWKAPTGLSTLGLGTRRFGGPENRGFAVSWQERVLRWNAATNSGRSSVEQDRSREGGNNCAAVSRLGVGCRCHLVRHMARQDAGYRWWRRRRRWWWRWRWWWWRRWPSFSERRCDAGPGRTCGQG